MGHISKAILLLTSYLALTLGQGLNVLIVCDERNIQAENGVDTAIKYLTQNNMANINKKSMVTLTGEANKAAGDICRELDSMIDSGAAPDVVLDLSAGGDTSEVAKSLSLTLGLPTVSTTMGEVDDITEWSALTAEQEKYLVQVRSPSDMFQYIIKDMATLTNITNAAILFDETFKMSHHYKNLLINMPVRHTMTEMDSGMLSQQLQRLISMDVMNFYILASPENIKNALMTADSLKLYGERYSWFVGTKNSDYSFDASCCSDMKVISFHPQLPSGSELRIMKGSGLYQEPMLESAFYADMAAKTLAAVAKMKKDGSWPEMTYTKCSEFSGGEPIERSLDLMSALKASGVEDVWGEVHFITNGESHMEFTLKVHLQKVMDKSLAESHEVGTWTAGIPSHFNFKSAEMEEKAALFKAKKVYKVVSVIQPPFMQWNETKNTYEGYTFDLMEEIKKILDIDYELYIATDGYGEPDDEGNWNGLVGELHNRRADIGLGAISVMAERENVIDYTVPYYDLVGISILMKKAKMPTNLFKFLSVLEDSVWGCILGAYFVTSVLLWCFDKWSPFSYQNNMDKFENDDETRYFNLKESLWFCMTSLTPQGGGEAPKNLSGRMVAATWWLFGFIIIASYTANLAAFLTVSRLEVPVGSLDDLIKQYKIQYAPINGSQTAKYFERMAYIESKFYNVWKDMSLDDSTSEYERAKLAVWDYPVTDKYTKIWDGMKEASLPMSFEEALVRVRHSPSQSAGFALIADATDVRYQDLITCDLQMVGDEFSRKPYALAVQQGSPLKDQLNDAILRLLNQRKLEGMKERWWNANENRRNCEKEDEDTGGISIHNIGGVFIVIFVGIVLALITLAAEYYYYKFMASKPSSGKVGDSSTKKVAEYDKKENKW
jgi:ionotropic glutamate receptor